MTPPVSSSRERLRSIAELVALAALTLVSALLSRAVVNDDPYITYRYARNLASGAGFVYNPGEPVLSTSAPLYALILAAAARLGVEPPHASLVLGALAAFATGALLLRHGTGAARSVAFLLVTSPLIWLATGMESSLYLALALGAFAAAAGERWGVAGLLAGCATLVRGDGLLVVGLISLAEAIQRRRIPWRSGLAASTLILPFAIAATIVYGSPVPATLRAKVQQASLGITGFFPGARFADGVVRLAAAYFEHTWLYLITLPLMIVGLIRLRHERRAWLIVAWGALQAMGYMALGVAPYRWYYIPLLPAVYLLIGLGISAISSRGGKAIGIGLAIIVLAAQARSLWEIQRSADPDVSRSDLVGIDALPETSGPLYRQAGTWLRENTPPQASVGVMEVGVIGYTAERRMIDYLGLLQPEVTDALGRRDIYWSIPHTQPDYLVLTAVNPLYVYDLLADAWFRAAYTPVAQLEDARFWGSPITIYQRRVLATSLTFKALEQAAGSMRLTGYAAEPVPLQAGMPIRIRLDWAKPDAPNARVSVSLIGPQATVIATDSRMYDTHTWPDTGGSVYHTLVAGPDVPAGIYRAHIAVETLAESGETTIGVWKSPLGEFDLPATMTSRADRFGDIIELIGHIAEPSRPRPGDEIGLTLYWRAYRPIDTDYTVFVHLEDGDGRLVLAADGPPRGGDYPTSIWSPGEVIDDPHAIRLPADLLPGTYHVLIGLYRLETGERLPVNESDQIKLETITIRGPSQPRVFAAVQLPSEQPSVQSVGIRMCWTAATAVQLPSEQRTT